MVAADAVPNGVVGSVGRPRRRSAHSRRPITLHQHGFQRVMACSVCITHYKSAPSEVSEETQSPDMHQEYTNDSCMDFHRRHVELATEHYCPHGLAAKVRACFQIYAHPQDTVGLHRVLGQRGITVEILSPR